MNVKLQVHKDTDWENLNNAGTIRGRILNGNVTIVFDRFVVSGKTGNNINFIQLPNKYIPKCDIPFFMFPNGIAPLPCNARVISSGVITCYIRTDGGQYNGTVSYPIY